MLALRRLFAVLSTIGLAASVCAYVGSFFGLTAGPVSNAQPWLFYFFAGVFVTAVPSGLAEYTASISDSRIFLKRFAETRPHWALPTIQFSFVFALVHFGLFMPPHPSHVTRDREWAVCFERPRNNAISNQQRAVSESCWMGDAFVRIFHDLYLSIYSALLVVPADQD